MTYSPEKAQDLLAQYYYVIANHQHSYDELHLLVEGVAEVRRNSPNVTVSRLTRFDSLRLAWKMAKFGLQHGRRDPHCPCMD